MFNFYKLFVVFAALLSFTAAKPGILGPILVSPSAISHQSVTQVHATHPVLVATPIVTAVHPIVTPILHHPEHIVIG
ncbi:PREDICTED: uncharacterized protein LOC108977195 [Bactrocera latifrons]|uniref:uncharacterized protein LOC108977195 n=1 Tax=Bactrocera latifrons TaxID=174628 RepID=UPI0008DE1227|nr:PREDICTED: uncharacterized protein LOC108977195 [Bactrocera latifrons]